MKASFFIIFSCMLLISLGCSEKAEKTTKYRSDELYIKYDGDYTDNLLGRDKLDSDGNKIDAPSTVDELRIYKTVGTKYGMYDLDKLYKKELMLITKDPLIIRKLIVAGQSISRVDNIELDCYNNKSNETYHIISYDYDTNRAGYYIFIPCGAVFKECGIIHPIDEGSHVNTAFLKTLHELNIIK